jgi:2-oxoisovalerate dehydrogenase E1 component
MILHDPLVVLQVDKLSKENIPRHGEEEAYFIANAVFALPMIDLLAKEPVARTPEHADQWNIIKQAFGNPDSRSLNDLMKEVSSDPDLQGVSKGQLLLEYTSALLARELGEHEFFYHKQTKIQFAIPGLGHELVGAALQRWLQKEDALSPYYRQEMDYILRGGTVYALALMTAQREADSNSGGVVLAGHTSASELGIIATISNVGAHVLAAAGIARGIELRRKQHRENESWKHFGDPDAISVCHIGDASMAQGEVKEAIEQVLLGEGSPMLLVVNNNGSGISTDVAEGSVGGDPIAGARGYAGLKIFEVDGTDVQKIYDTFRDAVAYVRTQRKPAIAHVFNMYKLAHSSSDGRARYTTKEELKRNEQLDPMPKFRQYLIDHQVATTDQLNEMATFAKSGVEESIERALAMPSGDPHRIYRNHYSSAFTYGPYDPRENRWTDEGELDVLQTSKEPGIKYIEKPRTDTQKINLRQAITVTLAQEMKRDPNIILFGEDVADLSSKSWNAFESYFRSKFEDRTTEFTMDKSMEIEEALLLIAQGRGFEIEPTIFATLVDILGGKGGVFKISQFLQFLFGRNRVWNSTLAEASILGTAVGYALAGFLPVVEIQFDSYLSPAYQQLIDQIATLRWRSGGQFTPGMVIRIQGLNRLGGPGGIGHGNVILGKLIGTPGIRVVVPGSASDAGPLLRESIRLVREHGEVVVFYEPISGYNTMEGNLQDPDAHIPLGKANIVEEGEDVLILTYGNNIPVVKKAQEMLNRILGKTDGKNTATIIDLRTFGTQTPWLEIAKYIKHDDEPKNHPVHGKIMIVESERSENSAGSALLAKIARLFFYDLDAPPVQVSALDTFMPAGKENEEFVLPQVEDVVAAALKLIEH